MLVILAVVLVALFEHRNFRNATGPRQLPGSCSIVNAPTGITFYGVCNNELPKFVSQTYPHDSYYFANASPLEATNDFTLSVCVSPPISSQYGQTVVYNGNMLSGWGIDLRGCYGSQLNVNNVTGWITYPSGGNTVSQPVCTGVALSPNVWHQIVMERNSTTTYFYIDGQKNLATANPNSVPGLPDSYFSIGAEVNSISPTYSSAQNFYSGEESNVQIYNTTLSANEVTALYDEGLGGEPIEINYLEGWWPLNGNANDYSPWGLDAFINNATGSAHSTYYSDYTTKGASP